MEKPTKLITLQINLPPITAAWITFFFNTYQIQTHPGGAFIRFAFVDTDNQLHGQPFGVLIATTALDNLKKNITDYVNKLPDANTDNPLPKFSAPPYTLPAHPPAMANHIALAQNATHGEIILTVTRFIDLVNITKEKAVTGKLDSIPVALLHSTTEIHTRFLLELFKTTQ
jgi:hypothetical protein